MKLEYRVPGLLVIDTPGHEAFANLRSRGSNLCDIAVLVVDIMHGLEPQTIESLKMLRDRRTPFVVALNKIDRLYDWKPHPNTPIKETLAKQAAYTLEEFQTRTNNIIGELQAQGLNSVLYYDNDNYKKNVSVVPTSAMTGEGVPDLLMLLVQLTQQLMSSKMMYLDVPEATILEAKPIEGLGATVDVVLVNGKLHEGDTIVACGMQGPIVTHIRALLTPRPMREIRIKVVPCLFSATPPPHSLTPLSRSFLVLLRPTMCTTSPSKLPWVSRLPPTAWTAPSLALRSW